MKNALINQQCLGEIVSKQKYMLYFDKWTILSGFYKKEIPMKPQKPTQKVFYGVSEWKFS